MHLLFEGLFPLHMKLLFSHLPISEEVLNARVLGYPYAYFEVKPARLHTFEFTSGSQTGQKLVIFTLRANSSSIFIDSASVVTQMWQLFHITPLLIDADISPDDQHYKCFVLLQDVGCILCSPIIAQQQINSLASFYDP